MTLKTQADYHKQRGFKVSRFMTNIGGRTNKKQKTTILVEALATVALTSWESKMASSCGLERTRSRQQNCIFLNNLSFLI